MQPACTPLSVRLLRDQSILPRSSKFDSRMAPAWKMARRSSFSMVATSSFSCSPWYPVPL
jgi:hypothetical protein